MKGYNRILAVMVCLIVAGSSLVSCTKENRKKNGAPIRISVRVNKTKGAVTATSSLESSGAFTMDAYIDDEYYSPKNNRDDNYPENGLYINGHTNPGNVYLDGGKWTLATNSDGEEYLWIDNLTTRFWAWHPVNADGRNIYGPVDGDGVVSPAGENFKFTYTTPATNGTKDADNAIDLLFAYSKKEHKKDSKDDEVGLTFHHALSQVRFCVSTDDGTFDAKSLQIKNITLTNLNTSGTGIFSDSGNGESNNYSYDPTNDSYDNFVWSSQSDRANFGQDYNASFTKTTVTGWTKGSYTKSNKTYDLYTCENVFFMIPQTIAKTSDENTTNMISVTFIYQGEAVTKTVNLVGDEPDTWLGDHYYTYKLKATIVGRNIEFGVNLVGWSDRDDKLFI